MYTNSTPIVGLGVSRLRASFTMDTSGLRRMQQDELLRMRLAADAAVSRVTRRAEKYVEAQTKAAMPGRGGASRLYRGWGSDVIRPKGKTLDMFGLVRPNGRKDQRGWKTLQAYAEGARIRGWHGQWLAIPTPAAGVRGRDRLLRPRDWERQRGRKLRLVTPKGGRFALLVADDVVMNRKGAARAATGRRQAKYGQQGSSRVIFVLVKEVQVRKLLHLRAWVVPFRNQLKTEFLTIREQALRGDFHVQ